VIFKDSISIIKNYKMKNIINRLIKIEELLDKVPKEHKYWLYLEDQEKYLKAMNRIPFKWFGLELDPIFFKYKHIGIPPIYPNYEAICRDFPEIERLTGRLNSINKVKRQ
jgi:hypothetical protein